MLHVMTSNDGMRPLMTCLMTERIKINPVLFGKLIALHRRRMRINQQELAKHLYKGEKLSDAGAQSRMSRLESGKVQVTRPMVDRVSKIFDIPVFEIKQKCSEDFTSLLKDQDSSLCFDPFIIECMPTIQGYIQIINAHLKGKNLKGVAFGFQQLCDAADRFFNTDPDFKRSKK